MCIFCKIINNEIPCIKIYESDTSLAFLDVNPTTKGHCLVIPKKHYDNFIEVNDHDRIKYLEDLHHVTKMINNKLKPNGINILSNINEIAGQTVFHTHFHIIPRYDENDGININFEQKEYDLQEIQKLIVE